MSKSDIIARYPPYKDNLLLILHELQNGNQQHYLSDEDLKAVAEYLNITLAEVYGVATYYSMYSLEPRGRHIIRVCKSPVCDMLGSAAVTNRLQQLLGIRTGETTADGLFTLEESACLGCCNSAPSMIIDEEYFGALDDVRLTTILERYRRG